MRATTTHLSAIAAIALALAISGCNSTAPVQDYKSLLGENVHIFYPTDDMDSIHALTDSLHARMMHEQFGADRYALLFMPGDYQAAGIINVPYYMQVSGLGKLPYDVKLHTVHTPAPLRNDNGTCTFWRSLENVSVVGTPTYEHDSTLCWAVSQAAPIRRVHSDRTVRNQWHNGWVSGGFTADCDFQAPAGSDGQQQWYTRNSHLEHGRGEFKEGSWNFMFQGVTLGAEADTDTYVNNWDTGGNVTFIDATPVIREKPFVYLGADKWLKVFRPALRHDAKGLSYTRHDMGLGETLDLADDFYIAKPGVTAAEINEQLSAGKHVLFQPGFFELEEPLRVSHPGTIVMGLGFATLVPSEANHEGAIVVDDVDGVTVASLLFDAHHSSQCLLRLNGTGNRHASNPTLLADVFFRVGGFTPQPVHVDCALDIDANDVIGDHFWIWRADHGVPGSVGWEVNTANNGLRVRGDDVTIYGLFNEHFQQYQTLWEGERGRTYFYQCETPYDALEQSRYMSDDGTKAGYAAYKVADTVNDHLACGMGIYDVYFGTDIRMENSVEVPEKPDVKLYHVCNVSLSDPGPRGIGYIVNGKVPSTYNTWRVCRTYIDSFANGEPR